MLMAADLVAHWHAADLLGPAAGGTVGGGATVASWVDRVQGVSAGVVGAPVVVDEAFAGRAAVRLEPFDGIDAFQVDRSTNPLRGADDFAVAVAFSTRGAGLQGGAENWYQNSGLVDASNLGFTEDWGLAMNSQGQLAAGLGSGFGQPARSVYSSVAPRLDDGQLHVAVLVRRANTLVLHVDEQPLASRTDASPKPRSVDLDVRFGTLRNGTQPWSGDLAEVRMYRGTMADAEAAALVRQLRDEYDANRPIGHDDFYSTRPGRALVVPTSEGVLANDRFFGQGTLSARLVAAPAHGSLTFNADGSYAYQPDSRFTGIDTFTYQATGPLAASPVVTVRLAVQGLETLRRVAINEFHSDPEPSYEAVEFLELFNGGTEPVELSGWRISGGVDWTFPAQTIVEAGAYVVVAQDPALLKTKYGARAFGPWRGALDADGETITVHSSEGELVDRVSYSLGYPWPTVGIEGGPSAQLLNERFDNDLGGHWRGGAPTPGAVNGVRVENSPPATRQVTHTPATPRSGQDVTITIKATDDDGMADVQLEYQAVDAGQYVRITDPAYATTWTRVALRDDGQQGDVRAGDGVYSVVLPGSLQTHRRLMRYRFQVADRAGQRVQLPYADDPQPNFAYFTYDGIPDWVAADRPGVTPPVTYGSQVMNSLQAFHLIAQETDVTRSQYNSAFNEKPFRGTLVYQGRVYDHIVFHNRGQNSTYVTGKNKWKLRFHPGHEVPMLDDHGLPWGVPVRELNLGTAASPWARPNRGLAGMDEALAFKFFNLAGVPAPMISSIQYRIIDSVNETDPANQYNSDLWGLYLAYEDPNGRFLEQHGLPDGNVFRMQGGTGNLRHRGVGLPGNLSDLRAFTSLKTGYTRVNPIQPVEWWRANVDLERYYSYRGVIESLNHSDLRDQENSIQYFNSETGKWAQLPWDLDLLYEEFARWGPSGVQTTSPLEKVRLALGHPEIRLEYQARLRELRDLLFNRDQGWQAVEEYARHVEPFAAVDRAMWDHNPRTAASHKGFFYKSPAPYDGGAACCVRRALTSADFEGMVNWVKEFLAPGGHGGGLLDKEIADPDIPLAPRLTYSGAAGFPVTGLKFSSSAFQDPQAGDSFAAMQWRLAEVTDQAAPSYDAAAPVKYEVTPLWQSGSLTSFQPSLHLEPHLVRVGHAYRVRVRMQDSTGRWSHWSEPVQFVPTTAASPIEASLRVSEVHYHPAGPSDRELAAGYEDGDEFEFLELVNVGNDTLDLRGTQLVRLSLDGDLQGVDFDFGQSSITSLAPGARVLVVEDLDAFVTRHGNGLPVAGQWEGTLSNGSERITLAAYGQPFVQFQYDDGWFPRTDGNGPSLEVIDPSDRQSVGTLSQRGAWIPSAIVDGTPGRPATPPGDANLDAIFNSADLVLAWQAGKYEDSVAGNSSWAEGDWNGDGDFNSADLVLAFQKGDYSTLAIATDEIFAAAEPWPRKRRTT